MQRTLFAADVLDMQTGEAHVRLADDSCFVSPELVLVDPELAARERARLLEGGVDSALANAEVSNLGPIRDQLVRAAKAAEPTRAASGRPGGRRQTWRVPAGVAAAIVIGLLLLDVKVEVGRSPAGAESNSALPAEAPEASAPAPSPGPSLQPEVRRFAWAPVKGATGYRVEIHRGLTRIFVRETRKPQVTVPRMWKESGRTRALGPGEYRWYVWPIVSGRRSARAVVQASLSIPAA